MSSHHAGANSNKILKPNADGDDDADDDADVEDDEQDDGGDEDEDDDDDDDDEEDKGGVPDSRSDEQLPAWLKSNYQTIGRAVQFGVVPLHASGAVSYPFHVAPLLALVLDYTGPLEVWEVIETRRRKYESGRTESASRTVAVCSSRSVAERVGLAHVLPEWRDRIDIILWKTTKDVGARFERALAWKPGDTVTVTAKATAATTTAPATAVAAKTLHEYLRRTFTAKQVSSMFRTFQYVVDEFSSNNVGAGHGQPAGVFVDIAQTPLME